MHLIQLSVVPLGLEHHLNTSWLSLEVLACILLVVLLAWFLFIVLMLDNYIGGEETFYVSSSFILGKRRPQTRKASGNY